ncbi:hypothetical protein B0H14DRAFT_3463721 [Mycena olivaceomarginata]|nr:hypothetical protein B0H14DRAFT_3463721 [Mycena olivaceomarginata]
MRCNVMLLIHAPHTPGKRGPGKVVVICEPNITDVEARESKAADILQSRMCEILKGNELRINQVWVNNKRRERNDVGICLTLALEWMVELVAGGKDGLNIQRSDNGQVTGIKGFRLIEM